ncbi:unnamed protein product [Sphenostylis stenocarpa]|uniref:Uncharacterized protein n=1 Tax=Sphenostylis stenocarpa TaxID=92480 RepID=A0AA86S0M8_9FABA|nr:unnamed protein product [Sphenostylis stenocarpa]
MHVLKLSKKLPKTYHPAFFLADAEPVYANSQSTVSDTANTIQRQKAPKLLKVTIEVE